MSLTDKWYQVNRLGGLRRFAVAISLLNLLGHAFLGFEQSWAQPLVALGTAYAVEILLELVGSWSQHRTPLFFGKLTDLVDFLLSAHITGLAVSMLLYANDRLMPIIFGTAVAICSKAVFRVRIRNASRHFFNPSNLGISFVLVLFPWVGIAQPYQFTENLHGPGDWMLPALIVVSGSFLNTRFTHRLPLILTWLGCFGVQALIRSTLFGTPLVSALMPMSGVAFILYTFYMVTDPATTPSGTRGQVLFGAAVAAAYGLLLAAHVVFGLFFALTIVCLARGSVLYFLQVSESRVSPRSTIQTPVALGRLQP